MFSLVASMMLLAAQSPQEQPPQGQILPPGHRPFGPPLREDVIEGWETFIADAMPPDGAACSGIDEPMVRALDPPGRGAAVRRLSDVSFVRLSDAEAASLIGVRQQDGRLLARQVFEDYLTEMRRRKHRAEVERSDSWSVADQRSLERLAAHLEAGSVDSYRPYLVRAVAKFGDGHGGAPSMHGVLCRGDLYLQTLVFSYTIPPSVRVPAVVFLEQPPARIIASVWVAW